MLAIVLSLLLFPATAFAANNYASHAASDTTNIDEELVYLDATGRIIVLDPYTPDNMPTIKWQSPVGGFDHIALGDFNADGDDEIAAISVSNGNSLVVYDPVAEGIDPDEADGHINSIPWQTLYTEALPGTPLLVATGQLNLESAALEIVTYVKLDESQRIIHDDTHSLVIRYATGDKPDGRTWAQQLRHDTDTDATWIGAGNINGKGPDDLVMLSDSEGALYVFAINGFELERIFRSTTPEKAWRTGTIGQFVVGGEDEIAASRNNKVTEPSLYVSHYTSDDEEGDFEDYFLGYNDPPPNVLFFADIDGNNDEEIVALRALVGSHKDKPRMFIRDGGMGEYVDSINMGEPELDSDNGYRAGVGADVDGDGRDEIIIMRDDNIRIYIEPETYPTEQNYARTTNQRDIATGNLDATGLSNYVRVEPEPSVLSTTLSAVETSDTMPVLVQDADTGQSVAVGFYVENSSNWVTISESEEETPTYIGITLDGTGLATGVYTDNVVIEPVAGALSIPDSIELQLTVEPGAKLTPDSVGVALSNCDITASALVVNVISEGTPGGTAVISLDEAVGWASVSSGTGTIPHVSYLTLDGRNLDGTVGKVNLVLNATIDGSSYSDTATVTLMCGEPALYLPLVTE